MKEHILTYYRVAIIELLPGMKPQERINVRQLFEKGNLNILVATSVAEEGLDIKACNMVIRYMYIKDMIAKIQSRGKALDAAFLEL